MTETNEQNYDSQFEQDALTEGGGFGWDGKTVTITYSKLETREGSKGPYHMFVLKGIEEGGDQERWQNYFLPYGAQPSADFNFIDTKDAPGVPLAKYSKKRDFGLFLDRLLGSGFDAKRLKKPAGVSGIVGARIEFKGEDRMDYKSGKPKMNDKGYPHQDYYPVKTHGYSDGTVATIAAGNGALKEKAQGLVKKALEANGGSLTKAQLAAQLPKFLNGDADRNAVISLALKDEFLKGLTGTTYESSTLTATA